MPRWWMRADRRDGNCGTHHRTRCGKTRTRSFWIEQEGGEVVIEDAKS